MSTSVKMRVGLANWFGEHSILNSATAVPTAATNGILIPPFRKAESVHFVAHKTNVADFDLYGLMDNTNIWVKFDSTYMRSTTAEATRVIGASAYRRICSVRLDANAMQVPLNTYWGFSEA